jgi:hypothetical protein
MDLSKSNLASSASQSQAQYLPMYDRSWDMEAWDSLLGKEIRNVNFAKILKGACVMLATSATQYAPDVSHLGGMDPVHCEALHHRPCNPPPLDLLTHVT